MISFCAFNIFWGIKTLKYKKIVIKSFLFLFTLFIFGGIFVFGFETSSNEKSSKVKDMVAMIEKNASYDTKSDYLKSDSKKENLDYIPKGNTKKVATELEKGFGEAVCSLYGR